MSYSRAIDGARDAAVLAGIFRRIGAELRRNESGVTTIYQSPAAVEIKPDGAGGAWLMRSPVLTPGRACARVPFRTKAAAGILTGNDESSSREK